MSPENHLVNRFILPDLKFKKFIKQSNKTFLFFCVKKSQWEVCRKCPTKSFSVHDKRMVTIRDARLQNKHVKLIIEKRRFRCPRCKSVFTESIDGIKVGFRTTEKYRNELLYDFRQSSCATTVAKKLRCSTSFVTYTVNERLELELRKSRNAPWSKTVLIDEHAFGRNKKFRIKDFVTCFVDNPRRCLREMASGRNHTDLYEAIKHIPGKENVSHVVIDMSANYKNFAESYFTNARIVVDKFHVLRLLQPAIRKYRKEVTGDDRKNPIRRLLLRNGRDLKTYQKRAIGRFCRENPTLGEVYNFKERINNFYRIKGFNQASRILTKITDDMALSKIKEIRTMRRTGLTNARIEGFNRKCKLLQRQAYGFQNFENYRLRALYKCS